MTRNFPTVLEAVDIHDDLIRQFGGESGLRDAARVGVGHNAPPDWVLRRHH